MMQKRKLLQQHSDKIEPPDEKLVACVQHCIRCGKTLPFKKGRKSCPYCQGTLRTKVIVINSPSSI